MSPNPEIQPPPPAHDTANPKAAAKAPKAAKNYLDMMSFSRSGLIEQLESSAGDQYTNAQAV